LAGHSECCLSVLPSTRHLLQAAFVLQRIIFSIPSAYSTGRSSALTTTTLPRSNCTKWPRCAPSVTIIPQPCRQLRLVARSNSKAAIHLDRSWWPGSCSGCCPSSHPRTWRGSSSLGLRPLSLTPCLNRVVSLSRRSLILCVPRWVSRRKHHGTFVFCLTFPGSFLQVIVSDAHAPVLLKHTPSSFVRHNHRRLAGIGLQSTIYTKRQ
jgi:hypothetical protein